MFVKRQFSHCSRITVSLARLQKIIHKAGRNSCAVSAAWLRILLLTALRCPVSDPSTGLFSLALSRLETANMPRKLHRGLLSGALPNYHVGSELTLRLLDSRGVCKSHEDQYYSAVVIKSPTLRAAIARQGATHLVQIYAYTREHFACTCRVRRELNAICRYARYAFGEPDWSHLSAHFPIVRARRSRTLIKTTWRNARETIKRKEDVEVETNLRSQRRSLGVYWHRGRVRSRILSVMKDYCESDEHITWEFPVVLRKLFVRFLDVTKNCDNIVTSKIKAIDHLLNKDSHFFLYSNMCKKIHIFLYKISIALIINVMRLLPFFRLHLCTIYNVGRVNHV